jgi:hypothetical protein
VKGKERPPFSFIEEPRSHPAAGKTVNEIFVLETHFLTQKFGRIQPVWLLAHTKMSKRKQQPKKINKKFK